MVEPTPTLERVRPPRGRGLRVLPVAMAGIVVVSFLLGLSLGSRITPERNPVSNPSPAPSQTASPPPALVASHLSPELLNVYIDTQSNGGWVLCRAAASVTCEATIAAVPAARFVGFETLPLMVSTHDWAQLPC